ncbi:hypothetical protein ACP4OV_010278 [Aristida adscensionis]
MPDPAAVSGRVLLAAVLCCVVAIAPASCSNSGNRSDVISFCFPPFKGVDNGDDLLDFDLSWDAGIVDGALHLTVDDVHKPPVNFPPDDRRLDGRIILRPAILLAVVEPSYPYYRYQRSPSRQDASFNTTFTMSVSRSRNQAAAKTDGGGVLFEIVPDILRAGRNELDLMHLLSDGSNGGYVAGGGTGVNHGPSYESLASNARGDIFVELGKDNNYLSSAMYVSITPAPPPPTRDAPPANYTVWIDYDGKTQIIWVYVDEDKKPKPAEATIHALNISGIFKWDSYGSYFGLFASKDRRLPSCKPVIYSWSLTVDRLSKPMPVPVPMPWDYDYDHDRRRGLGKGWIVAIVVSCVLLGVGAAAATVFHFREHIVAMVCAAAGVLASRYQALKMKLKLSQALRRLPGVPREFKYADVKKATRNFHESMRLGRGGFGAVYKGTVLITTTGTGDGEDGPRRRRFVNVAVKKFTRKEDRGYEDFLAEVAIINRLRHKNIVPLIGWCYENGKLLLIYQYMPNGSLDQHLFRESRHQHLPPLRWETRYNIIGDVAAGLHYVHHEYERVVLHRDIKASNIMLDDAFGGRLGDFGLARVVGFNKNSITDVGVAGTWGFIAPEYAISHRATRQTDVYAFGVLVLEVVTGRRSLSAVDDPFPLLADWVWWLHGHGRLLEAVDHELINGGEVELDADDAVRLLLLGLACSNPKPSDRPSMAEVVQIVSKSMPPPNVPLAKPAFLWPPEGELELLDNSDDDLIGVDHGDSSWSHREATQSHGGFVISIGSLEISIGRSRKLRSL